MSSLLRRRQVMYQQGSPVDRLPEEILSYIFTLGPHPDPIKEHPDMPESRESLSPCAAYSYAFPFLVAGINKHWRRVALSTSELWSKISVTTDEALDTSAEDESCFYGPRTCLMRSGNYPLDIFFDTRDPEWDFSEFDRSTAGSTPGCDHHEGKDYRHPFTLGHMRLALSFIRPYLHRCRSMVILTDRWAPMHLALNCFSTGSLEGGSSGSGIPRAPLLESLVLMRCNEFVSLEPNFIPEELSRRVFLPFGGALDGTAFPRLRRLTLSGVHTKWSSLPLLLPGPSSHGCQLRRLELEFHCRQVRPQATAFRQLLERCPRLEELCIRASGPLLETRQEDIAGSHGQAPVPLPRLRSFTLGYDESVAGIDILRMIDAPRLRDLQLENNPHALSERSFDTLLTYFALQTDTFVCSDAFRIQDVMLRPVFPLVQNVILRSVTATMEAFQMFFASFYHMRSLMLCNMQTSAAATIALRPSRLYEVAFCPCPLLDQLIIRGYNARVDPALPVVLHERAEYGAFVRDVRVQPVARRTVDSDTESMVDVEDLDYLDEMDEQAAMGILPLAESPPALGAEEEDFDVPDDIDFPEFLVGDFTPLAIVPACAVPKPFRPSH